MKKLILLFIFILSIFFIDNSFATVVQIWTLPWNPDYIINKGDDLEYLRFDHTNWINRYDKNGVSLGNIYPWTINTWCSYWFMASRQAIFESIDYIYLFMWWSETCSMNSTNTWYGIVFRYDKNNKIWSAWQSVGARSQYAGDFFNLSVVVDENKLVFNGNVYIDFTSPIFEVLPYTWSVTSGYTWITSYWSYRLSLNTLLYLDENLKKLVYKLKDTQWDIITIEDVFVTTYNLLWYKYLYDVATGIVYFSFYGDNDLRRYYNYEIWTSNYIDNEYYQRFSWTGGLVTLSDNETMWYNYNFWNYAPFIELINPWWTYSFYFSSWSVLYKDSDINIDNYIKETSGWTGGWWDTGTGTIDVENIFNTDLDGDGTTSITEALKSIFLIPARLFSTAWQYIIIMKNWAYSLLNHDEPVYKHIMFNFMPQTYAEGWFFTNMIHKVEENEWQETTTFLWKYVKILQYWFYFVILIYLIWLYIVNKRKND